MENQIEQENDNNNNNLIFEWQYHMRREMQEIYPSLYLGPYGSAIKSKLDSLLNAGITHIICVRQGEESKFIKPNFPDRFIYLELEISDSPNENIIRFFSEVKDFVDDCFLKNGKVLIHGNTGISRSAALVIAYLMETKGWSCDYALKYTQNRRFCIFPNEGFRQQLREYEPILEAKVNSSISTSRRSEKRPLDINNEDRSVRD